MSLKTFIVDAFTKIPAKVDRNGAILTTNIPGVTPKLGQENKQQFYSAVLGSTGANSGTISQNVNGSSTPQSFRIDAHLDYDIHIIQIMVIVADTAVEHRRFGFLTALTNGFDLKITESGTDTFIINKAKTGGELIAFSGFGKPYGTGVESFEVVDWDASKGDAQVVNIPIGEWVPNGLRIGRGTTDKLTSIVNDDLTGLTELTIRVFGYKNIPIEEA